MLYEGYGPHGIAMLVETATDNVVRTVANVRMHFKDHGGNLGTTGSVAFQFQRMGVFRLAPEGLDQDALELDLIDHGLEEMGEGTGREGREADRHPLRLRALRPAAGGASRSGSCRSSRPSRSTSPRPRSSCPRSRRNEVLKLVDALEQDDDVQRVFHNLA